ncbi:MAG: M28 family peptidase, partial [bacterium]|nr:M28 family peptidase [bacterium]
MMIKRLPFFLTMSVSAVFSVFLGGVWAETHAIQEATLRAHTQFLADDLLEGRGVGTRGEALATRYIAAQFAALGLQPGGEADTYFQQVPLVATTADPAMVLSFQVGDETLTPTYLEDFVANTPLQTELVELDRQELVFVGYGIQAPEYEWDDYKGADLRGKVLLVLNNDPDTGDPAFFGGSARLYYGRWSYKYEMAAKMGADGAILIHTTPSASYPWQVVQTSWSGEQYALPRSEPKIKVEAWITEAKIKAILHQAGLDLEALTAAAQRRDFAPVPLGIRVSSRLQSTVRAMEGTNVLGLLPGSDPTARDEVVIFTAHHDHLGIGSAVDGDSIYNGGLDNASGVAAMLTLAQAFAAQLQPPRRSILFMAVTAEESGLLGSAYYAQHPTFAPGQIVANFNLDGLNIFGRTRDLSILGFGKTDLDPVFQAAAERQNRVIQPDPMPEKGSYYRSDHFSFAKIGVPSYTHRGGLDVIGQPAGWGKEQAEWYTEHHYHQPSDEYSPAWNVEGAMEDLRLV